MRSSGRPERRLSGRRRASRGAAAGARHLLLAASLALLTRPGLAEERLLVRGLGDAEVWNTGAGADAFSRDDGETAGLGRLRLWAVGAFTDRFQVVLVGEVEGGDASGYDRLEGRLEQGYARYTFGNAAPVIVQAGKLTLPIGSFARRYYSDQNPLIGGPLDYELSYPLGVQVNGAVSRFDYMVAFVDEPFTREDYEDSEPQSSPRPMLAAGLTPITGLRVGAYYTRGEYLSEIAETWLLPDREMSDYHEKVIGLDLQYSIGHFELNGELTQTRLEVPAAKDAHGRVWYVEPKYTFSPRWYGALRWERGSQAIAYWIWDAIWTAEQERVDNLEAAVGFRIDRGLLVKASYRTTLRNEDAAEWDPQGHGVALQLSYRFDVNSWFDRPR